MKICIELVDSPRGKLIIAAIKGGRVTRLYKHDRTLAENIKSAACDLLAAVGERA